jgi:hypothetical protein
MLSAFAWFFLNIHRPSPSFDWIGFPASFREHDFPRVGLRGCSYFVMFRPPSLLVSQIVPTAASFLAGQPRLFTSEQNVRGYLRTHRTCYPPDYRQLAERGLSPRKIRSLVGCSRMMPTFPLLPLKFRRADFLRYGFKAGLSDGAFPSMARSSPRAVGIRLLCPALACRVPRAVPRDRTRLDTSARAVPPLYPRGPRSGPGSSVPVHPHLIDPSAPLASTARLRR